MIRKGVSLMKKAIHSILVAAAVLLFFSVHNVTAEEYSDSAALEGIQSSRTLFDINLSQAGKLELYLGVIMKTRDDLLRQGVKPEIILAFRGASVRLITTERWAFSEEDQKSLEKASEILAKLHELGVRIEACSIATNLFKVDNSTLLPGIEVVGNTFVSLTGYQAKGFALIPIQ